MGFAWRLFIFLCMNLNIYVLYANCLPRKKLCGNHDNGK